MILRQKQQLFGFLLILVGSGFTSWCWCTALKNGYFYPKASMLFPACIIIGLGLIIFPGYREERILRGEDLSRLTGMKLITWRWWAILILALIAGGLDYYFLASL